MEEEDMEREVNMFILFKTHKKIIIIIMNINNTNICTTMYVSFQCPLNFNNVRRYRYTYIHVVPGTCTLHTPQLNNQINTK